jgi:WS/DGAT/MGAT family acyltransferase
MSRHRMSPGDAAWLHMDRPTNLMVVNGLMWFDAPLDLDLVRSVVAERLVGRFPRYRQRVVEPRIGGPCWEDVEDFDLDLHLHRLALPAPGDRAALQELVADIVVRPLDRHRPLWDMYVVEGYGEGTAIVSRMHHCIADGIALSRVLLSLTDDPGDVGVGPASRDGGHARVDALTAPVRAGAHAVEAALHEGLELVQHPGTEMPGLLDRGVADARALAKLVLTPPDAGTLLRGGPGVARRLAWCDPIPLDRVKAAGHATGTTLNDVVLTAVTGALHRYLREHGDDVDEIRAMVPFNLRPLDQPLPRELGNRFGLVYLKLPVGIADREERLRAVHREMAAIKASPEGVVSYAILGLVGRMPLSVEQVAIGLFAPKTSAVMTNVPGPRRRVTFAGIPVAGVLGWVPASGDIGLGVCIFSYAGDLVVGLQSAANLVPDPETIMGYFDEELKAVARLGRGGGRRRAGAARTTRTRQQA